MRGAGEGGGEGGGASEHSTPRPTRLLLVWHRLVAQANEAAEEHRRSYLRSLHGFASLHGLGADEEASPGAGGAAFPLRCSAGGDGPVGSKASEEVFTGGDVDRLPIRHLPNWEQPDLLTRLTSIFPTCGPASTGTAVALRGNRLGAAVSRGELALRLTLPDRTVRTISATFVSERKITCTLPPSPRHGMATIELLNTAPLQAPPPLQRANTTSTPAAKAIPSSTPSSTPAKAAGGAVNAAGCAAVGGGGGEDGFTSEWRSAGLAVSTPSSTNTSASLACGAGPRSAPVSPNQDGAADTSPTSSRTVAKTANPAPPAPQLEVCTFRYLGPYAAHRLRPAGGPAVGGTTVRVFGSGFVASSELAVCVRMRGVERCVPAAYISESEVRFLAPTFGPNESGDARVAISLNGQEYEPATELIYHYQASTCSLQ